MLSEGPIFVIGVGRSGTSLIHAMLAAHPNLAMPPETIFLRRFVVPNKLDSLGWIAVKTLLETDHYIQRLGISISDMFQRSLRSSESLDKSIYRLLLEEYAKKEGRQRFGDKDPRSIEFISVLSSIFPGCHIVHMVRDPRDVLLSKKKAEWSKGHSIYRHLFAGRVQMDLYQSFSSACINAKFHAIIYEELIANPVDVLKRLCTDTGLEFSHKMLDFGSSAKRLVSNREYSWKKETLGPLLASNHSKWNLELSEYEVALVEAVSSGHFELGGYNKSNAFQKLSLVSRMKVTVFSLAISCLAPVYLVYRKWTIRRVLSR